MSRAPITAASSSMHHQDVLWPMNMRSREQMESGPYPVREDDPDCSYYIRTGVCRFGPTCRFNHPPNRKLAIATARMKGEYPERIGQPECEYYLKTGTCKFGATCKFHHPRHKAGITGRVALNVLGYPLRPNEMECAYYMRNGQCKFGSTCKFHHPQPSNMMISLRGSAVYPPIHSPTTNQLSYPLSRASFIASPRWQSPSSYTPLVMQQGVVSVPGWNTYSGQPSSVLSSENQPPSAVNIQNDGASYQGDSGNIASEYGSVPMGYYAFQKDNVFPERPGQSECQFYMKTGDCKFGAVCKFHHPKERLIPVPDCHLSPLGLPLRQGEPLCVFYSRYGICKFGPSCKFDHPMRVFAYNTPASSSSTDSAAIRRFLASSPGTVPANFSSDGLMDGGSTNNRRLSLSEARQKPSGDNNTDSE
ncbi:zinc finger CCCH domain-containing protein ZFN-like [Salvia divinorum]|uniref:Zinc finger CCCH domain-containing protein ZFN-like n=1 Tax=Salvia divinorum TaxID=28513 RepID=A0ABD1GFS3_SALDI